MFDLYRRFMAWLESLPVPQPYDDLEEDEPEPWP